MTRSDLIKHAMADLQRMLDTAVQQHPKDHLLISDIVRDLAELREQLAIEEGRR